MKCLLRLPASALAALLSAALLGGVALALLNTAAWWALPAGAAALCGVALTAILVWGAWGAGAAKLPALAWLLLKLRASLPANGRRARIPTLGAQVLVEFDRFGIPTVRAGSRADAFRALGYVTARDRLFQMDLIRRDACGRLAEIFGPAALDGDLGKRVIGFRRAAPRIFARLPEAQKDVLRAYAAGVNAFIEQAHARPFEFRVLRYEPEPWAAEDTLLVVMQMFHMLCGDTGGERMLTVMESVLPPEVLAFLTPDTDYCTTVLGWGDDSRRPVRPIPVAALAGLLRPESGEAAQAPAQVYAESLHAGSNCWAVRGPKAAGGGALLANDLHLGFSVPNLWYRARLCYEGREVSGITVPGVPMVLAGSNTRVAWGLTNLEADCLDLVLVETNPDDPSKYLTPEGWRSFEVVEERIAIRGGESVSREVKLTIWGPVSDRALPDREVALRWTALDPAAVDIGLIEMDGAADVTEAARVLHEFGGPPLNVVLADAEGNIAYTVCGRLPVREGFDGSAARSWADGRVSWRGYIPGDELPFVSNPAANYLVSANNRAWGDRYPYVIGHDFSHSVRAGRISGRLRELNAAGPDDMFGLQLDTTCHLFEFYRELALSALPPETLAGGPERAGVRRMLEEWDGKAGPGSGALVVLTCFRQRLADAVFAPLLASCKKADEGFTYGWKNMDTPLRQLLGERVPELLPEPERYADWDDFIVGTLDEAVRQVKAERGATSLDGLRWDETNRAEFRHPLSGLHPALSTLLDLPPDPLPGCWFSVCVATPNFGATVRMVVAPGQEGAGFMHMPGGQSGHPLSVHYDDQQEFWARQLPLPFLPGTRRTALTLTP